MTSPTLPESAQQNVEGRSVRDVVEYSPEQVNDAWCHKILRKILQSLELQYAMQMPHRAITPDTVVFHANGEPLLISDDIDAAPAPDAQQADDLTALAGVLHYAITQELAPAGPLTGRVDGYGAALIATIDACMDSDPARRPRSIDAVRRSLGIAAPAPRISVVSGAPPRPAGNRDAIMVAAATAADTGSSRTDAAGRRAAEVTDAPPAAIVDAPRVRTGHGRRWAIAAGGGAIALALAVVLLPQLRHAGSSAPVVTTLTSDGARPGVPPHGESAPAGSVANAPQTEQATMGPAGNLADATVGTPAQASDPTADPASSLAAGASSGGTTRSSDDVDQSDDTARAISSAASSATARTAVPALPSASARAAAPAKSTAATQAPSAVSGQAHYQLQIKPWGVVYVDGVDRGVSPPLKRLALTPGPHTVRITNPKYRDSILEFDSAQTTSNGKIIVDFEREAQ